MIGYYNVSVILTYIGLISAMFGMTFALSGHIQVALMCLMVCGLCDCFDGSIARKTKRTESEKQFGVQIDSLCDLICFGAFPAVIGYSVGMRGWYWTLIMAFYMLAAVIRLGYFNVQEIERAQAGGGHRTYYEGLPVTSISLLAPLILLADTLWRPETALIYPFGLLAVGVLFILKRFKIKKPYDKALLTLAAVGAVIFVLVMLSGVRLDALRG